MRLECSLAPEAADIPYQSAALPAKKHAPPKGKTEVKYPRDQVKFRGEELDRAGSGWGCLHLIAVTRAHQRDKRTE